MSESASATSGSPERAGRSAKSGGTKKRGLFARIVLFVKQVIGELKKVVRPTRSELFTFFVVVIVFVLAIMAYVGVIDFGIKALIDLVFGA